MVLETYSFWADLWERVWRQLLQVALPMASAVAASGAGLDASAVALALFSTAVFTVLKIMSGIAASASAPVQVLLLDRAGSAAALTTLGFLSQEALLSWGDWASVDWRAVALASAASATVAALSYFVTPPVHIDKGDVDLTA